MKQVFLSFLAILSLFGCQTTSERLQAQYQLKYQTLLESIKNQSPEADFLGLRMAYTDTVHYDPYGVVSQSVVEEAFARFDEKDYQGCVRQADIILDKAYISMDGHYLAMVCHLELNNDERANYHQYVLNGLFSSISSGGNGRTFESAYTTISIGELKTFLGMLGLEVKEQGLKFHKGKPYDVMTVMESEIEEEFELYFDISIQLEKGYGDL